MSNHEPVANQEIMRHIERFEDAINRDHHDPVAEERRYRLAMMYAAVSQADSLASIAASLAKLASCVTDYDANYMYLRTGGGR